MRAALVVLITLVIALSSRFMPSLDASTGPIPLDCNRACLEGLVNQYLDAVVAYVAVMLSPFWIPSVQREPQGPHAIIVPQPSSTRSHRPSQPQAAGASVWRRSSAALAGLCSGFLASSAMTIDASASEMPGTCSRISGASVCR